ncbi:acetyl-CoA carboxylase biotin carboxyl carrier protein [Oscillochloris sp. ZM17-4]|uniref:acetyl-CoA carboxylase biotin carboxyl carrier protein n=1 Tax=Oscillochloris sp. ZM17-4 TaxID=2866714 RepID=UPI001C73B2F5|nr:acetyl-CoA carboxylase biotin carboxyl carrier protein [Oscillochloris sp. ZM17-4]MBX0328315.1 acetyl-CoA carboxylase biotin carboxyl carrier protein [Oscillochloris sp. ZM17-4]
MNDVTAETPESGDDFGLSAVRELLRLMNQTDITEILIERGDTKLHVKRGTAVPVPTSPIGQMVAQVSAPAAPTPVQPLFSPQQPAPESAHIAMPAGHTIAAPMVGTFYSAASPKDAPFAQEGDEIHVGDPVGIIEAMKMMNEIESEVSGRVARILVKNGQPVEYGQPLMVVEPL